MRRHTEPWTSGDPFAAVPVIAEGVEVREDSKGGIQLRKSPPPGLATRLGFRRPLRVNLDHQGTLFWKQIDGRRDLRGIEDVLREHSRQDAAASERAVILFTRMLMIRQLIALKPPEPGQPLQPGAQA